MEDGAMKRRHLLLVLAAAVLGGILLYLPVLKAGFFLDDYYQLDVLNPQGRGPVRNPIALYTFAEGALNRMGPVQGDLLPWWTDPGLRLSFCRPLSCLVHVIDYRLHGAEPFWFHLTNLFLWGLLLIAVCRWYADLSAFTRAGSLIAAVAALFYALDDAHRLVIFWPANRHALLSVMFCAWALCAYHRFRGTGLQTWRLFSLVLLGGGLLAGETAVGFLGWLIAYELFLTRGRIVPRARAAAPHAGLLVCYVALYALAGFGADRSASYVSPFAEPLVFARKAVAYRLPALWLDALNVQASVLDVLLELPGLRALPDALAILGLSGIFLAVLLPHLRRHRPARFMAVGALLSAVPAASTFSDSRQLLMPAIGVSWVLASFAVTGLLRLADAVRNGASPATRVRCAAAGGIACLVVVVHAGLAPVAVRQGLAELNRLSRAGEEAALEAEMPDKEGYGRVLLLNAPNAQIAVHVPFVRLHHNRPWPEAVWHLSVVPGPLALERVDEALLRVRFPEPGLMQSRSERLFRREPVTQGCRFAQGALRIEATRVESGSIRELHVSLGLPLDDPRVWLLAWRDGRWRRITPPQPGSRLELPAPQPRF